MESLAEKLKGINDSDHLEHAYRDGRRGRKKGIKNGQGLHYSRGSHSRNDAGRRERAEIENKHGNGRGLEDSNLPVLAGPNEIIKKNRGDLIKKLNGGNSESDSWDGTIHLGKDQYEDVTNLKSKLKKNKKNTQNTQSNSNNQNTQSNSNTQNTQSNSNTQNTQSNSNNQNTQSNSNNQNTQSGPKSQITNATVTTAELQVANKQAESASKARGLFNEMGSSAKQAISGADEKRRLREFGEPDLSKYSTAELKALTDRLKAESEYKKAAFPQESVKAKGMKASVDILTGLAGVAVTGVAAWAIVQKLKGDI